MSHRFRRSAAAGLVAAVALTLTACGGDDDKAGAGETKSASVAKAEPLTKDTFSERVSAAQLKAGSSHLEMDMQSVGQGIKASGDVLVDKDPRKTAMQLTMEAGSAGTMKMVLVDEKMYMNVGQMTQDKYVAIDLNDKSNPIGAQYSTLVEQMDPSAQLDQLEGALTKFEKKGAPVKIDGVETQPYLVSVDTKKITEAQGGAGAGAATAGMPATLDYTMYIGADDLMRRMTMDVAGTKMTMDYSKWGEDVDVKAPPKSQLSDIDPFKNAG